MYQSTFSRQDLFQVIGLNFVGCGTALFAGVVLHPIAAILVLFFFIGLQIFVSDMVAKDMYEPPYFRCDGCGNLHSEDDKVGWNDSELCTGCSSDKTSQIEYAISKPMFLKRLRKN